VGFFRRTGAAANWLVDRPWLPVGALLVTAGFALRAAFPANSAIALTWWILVIAGVISAALGFLLDKREEHKASRLQQRWQRAEPGTLTAGRIDSFPETMRNWALTDNWVCHVRVFSHTGWMATTGPGYADRFPSTQNGADLQRFLVRWRSLAPDLVVQAGELNAVNAMDHEVCASAGWMVLDGCHTPAFKFVEHGGVGTLYDVAVEVQRWQPAA
jgi:hypothetical protein